jgi:hypothetical protein
MKTLMRNGRDRRSENPSLGHAKKERVSLFGTDQRITSGPAARRPHSKAEYMTAPERFADSQIPLAPRAPSIHDPRRTSGRWGRYPSSRGIGGASSSRLASEQFRSAHRTRRTPCGRRGGTPCWAMLQQSIGVPVAPRFRTIQVCPKDLPPSLREIDLAANRPIGPSLWRTDDADS